MQTENLVVFKGTLEGIVAILDAHASFEAVLEDFTEKLKSAEKFFKGAQVAMRFKGRVLSKDEQDQMMALLVRQNILQVTFVHAFEEQVQTPKDTQSEWVREQLDKPNVALTYYHYGMVRSGQEIDYRGSVVVIGDVNPGGVIRADGHVIVIGTLNGRVHAGMDSGHRQAVVIATNMHPLQIGIGDTFAKLPEGEVVSRNKNHVPQIAYVVNNEIYVDEIDVKTMMHMVE